MATPGMQKIDIMKDIVSAYGPLAVILMIAVAGTHHVLAQTRTHVESLKTLEQVGDELARALSLGMVGDAHVDSTAVLFVEPRLATFV